ncbi:MAG: MetS family NSS transporter small subunit [Eubacteriales bacterium]|nr:MetS family NSS transporter small subunit [Eubacteriales bacterium]MDD4583540.1 MetS family NSS transporter small subunit [Eubacteriales bacterium]
MNTGAIIMMIIGCGGLWGGCAVAISLSMKYSKKNNA